MAENKSDRKPNAARTFSADLNDAFMIDSNLAGLAQSVEQKKQAVSSQSQELEALEARIRETEERLKQKQSKISGQPGMGGTQVSSQRQELEALEARIRETEERLKQKQSMISAQPGVGGTQNSPHGREPSGTTFGTYQDKNPPAALPNPRGPQSPASQAQQPLVQGQPAGKRSSEYGTEARAQGMQDDGYGQGAGHEAAFQSKQWPPPGTRFE